MGILLTALGLGLWSLPALADDTHYEGLPIGNQALGLGGAYVGVAADGSAAYHNPAGLTSRGGDKFAGGLTLFGFEKFEIPEAVSDSLGTANFTARRRGFLPIFVATVKTFGRRRKDGRRRFAIAYSSAQPRRTNRTFDVVLGGADTPQADTVRVSTSYRTVYHGLSFAWLASPKWSFGITNYLAITRRSQEEQTFFSDNGTALGVVERFNVKVFHFVLRLGATFEVHHKLRLGLVIQPPGIPFVRKGSYRRQLVSATDLQPNEVDFADVSSTGRAPIPFALRFGLGYRPSHVWLLSGDIGFVGPVRTASVVDDVPAEATSGGFFSNTTKRLPVVNLAFGAERTIHDKLLLRGGVFTDFSASPKIGATRSTYAPERIHRYGVSAAVGLGVSGLQMSVGTTVILGRGQGVGVQSNLLAGDVDYVRKAAKSRTILIHISGATSAVKRLDKVFQKEKGSRSP